MYYLNFGSHGHTILKVSDNDDNDLKRPDELPQPLY